MKNMLVVDWGLIYESKLRAGPGNTVVPNTTDDMSMKRVTES